MKYLPMIIFFTVFLAVFAGANVYLYIRGWQALPHIWWLRTSYLVLFLLFSAGYLLSRLLERYLPGFIETPLTWMGSYWFAAMVYFFLIIVLLDLLRLANHWFHIYPEFITANYALVKAWILGGSIVAVSALLIGGSINASHPRVRELEIPVSKTKGNFGELSIVAASDIHLGSIIGRKKVQKMVEMINSQKPDIILFAGDILDQSDKKIFHDDTGSPLRSLIAPYGVYAITGNHEYFGGVENAVKYIESLNIRMLRDSAILIDDKFILAGREDRQRQSMTGKQRKPISAILAGMDKDYPIILLDHQPFKLDEAVQNEVDLQVSGHTHHGQFWPLNLFTNAIYELSWGFEKRGNTSFYVSNGYGTWGPPVRIGNRPEIVLIRLTKDDNSQ
jgi:uncharacterized protein